MWKGSRFSIMPSTAVLVGLLLVPSQALITSQQITAPDLSIHTLLGGTGLAKGGTIKVAYQYSADSLPSSSAMIILADGIQMSNYYKITGETDADFFNLVCLAPSTMRLQLSTDGQPGDYTFTVPYTGQYTLLLIQCSPLYAGILDLHVDSTTLNPDSHGHLRHHLGIENVTLPNVYTGLLAAALALLIVWLVDLYITRKHTTALHLGCALALAMKVIEFGVQFSYYHRLDLHGQISNHLRVSSMLTQKLSMLSQMAMLFLIALGFKVNRQRLSGREVRLLLITFGLYVSLSSSQAACAGGSTDDKLCQAYEMSEYVMQSLILLGIIVSLNFNITHLRASLNGYPWSSSTPLQYKNLNQFHFFRWTFLLYLLLPTVLLIARIMLLSWTYAWLDQLLRQASFLAIYVSIAITFAPTDRERYVQAFEAPRHMTPQQRREAAQQRQREQQQQQQDVVIEGGERRRGGGIIQR